MALDGVKTALQKSVGFHPYPATLNLRLRTREDARAWERIKKEIKGINFAPLDKGFCSAKLFLVEIAGPAGKPRTKAAVLLPEVPGYPMDKIEVIAPMRLKDEFGVQDGDPLTVEFAH